MSEDELFAARRRLPRGTRVRGTVIGFPAGIGRAGAAVDLGDEVPGWVDVPLLPEEPSQWPHVGCAGLFEVLQHCGHEIRLFPLDAGMRGQRCRYSRWSGPEWAAITQRWPVGTIVEATVLDVFTSNREYAVRLGDCWAAVEYEGTPPHPGTSVRLIVEQLPEWTRRLIVRPTDHPHQHA
jgi:hypothetical protein